MSEGQGYPRVTFGIIVLNGEPFTRYCLRSIYPFAHQIVVVEGAHENARAVATEDGHSVDGTLQVLRRFQREEDPEGKVEIVTRDGFWPVKDELGRDRTPQSRAYAERATGDYLWQIDIDEFYRSQDLALVLDMLARKPQVTAVSFYLRAFWGRPDYEVDGWMWKKRDVHRLFRWGEGYAYVTHEPPTVTDALGHDLRDKQWVCGGDMARLGVFMYHYSHLFPRQVRQKALIYQIEKPDDCADVTDWVESGYIQLNHPFHVERQYWIPSWLRRYRGDHPGAVAQLMADVESGVVAEELRPREDVERLLSSWWYGPACVGLAAMKPVDTAWAWTRLQALRGSHIPRKLRASLLAKRRRGGEDVAGPMDRSGDR